MLRGLVRCERGTAAIEGAILLPLAISLMAGCVSFGTAYLDYASAQKALRDAARYLARVPSQYACTWGLTNAKTMAIANSSASVGWTADDIAMVPACPTASTGAVHLQAKFNYSPMMFGALKLPLSIPLTIDHEEPYVGLY